MQTFLPYPSFRKSAQCLDNKRLGKQRVEAMQILNILLGANRKAGWRNHPAVLQWKGFEAALFEYLETVCAEWQRRGYQNTKLDVYTKKVRSQYFRETAHRPPDRPAWLGKKSFHDAHKSRLLQKDQAWYEQFGWSVPLDLPYLWPVTKDTVAAAPGALPRRRAAKAKPNSSRPRLTRPAARS